MSDKEERGVEQEKPKSEIKFYIRLFVICLVMVAGYYAFSPYQKCLRMGYAEILCLDWTGW